MERYRDAARPRSCLVGAVAPDCRRVDGRLSSDFQWNVDAQCCPVSWVTRDLHRAAERFDTVPEAGEARAFAYLGSPDSVIVNQEMEIGVVGIDAHVCPMPGPR